MISFYGRPVSLIRSRRKSVSIRIDPKGLLCVSAPVHTPEREITAFLQSKRKWIEMHLQKVAEINYLARTMALDETAISDLKHLAQQKLPEIVAIYASYMGVSYGRITIRSQKGRWGSCSVQGNLSFNCLLMLAPDDVQRYVVVHELAHRKQMNHSAAFWREVECILPDYRNSAAWLKQNGELLIARMQQGGNNTE